MKEQSGHGRHSGVVGEGTPQGAERLMRGGKRVREHLRGGPSLPQPGPVLPGQHPPDGDDLRGSQPGRELAGRRHRRGQRGGEGILILPGVLGRPAEQTRGEKTMPW